MTLTNSKNVLIAALALLAFAGCTSTRMSKSPRDLEYSEIEKIKLGVTSKDEVISMFGAPVAIMVDAKGMEVFTFVSGDSRSQMWQVPPILVVYVDSVSSAKTKVLNVTFSGDTVIDWRYTVSAAGGGFQAGGVQGGTIGN